MDRQPNNALKRASLTYDLRVLITRRWHEKKKTVSFAGLS